VFYVGVKLGLTLKEDHGMRAFKNRMLRKIFGPTREEITGTGGNCVRRFVIYMPYPILFRWSNEEE
jgi:hypothetical protein